MAVVLGTASVPIHQLLRMGRGAMIELDAKVDDDVQIFANDVAVARGKVLLRGERISVAVTAALTTTGAVLTDPAPQLVD